MNLKYKILSLGLLMSSVTFTSCDNFLTQENKHQLTTQNFYKSIGDCEKGLAAVYNAFKNTNIYHPMDENRRSDLAVEGNKDRKQFDNEAYMQTFNDAYGTVRGKWSALYTGVFRANQVLEGVEKVRSNTQDEVQLGKLNQIEAQAYFLRGLFYFYLNTSFNNGNVPYVDYVPSKEDDYYKKCTPSEEIKKYYREDIQKAIDLGLNDKWKGEDLGRVTSWAAKAVLGKSYLYDADYDKAAEYFKDIIDNGGFSLVENIVDNFTAAHEFNSESILEVSYSTQHNTEFGTWSESTLYNIWGMNVNGCGDAWLNTVPAFWLVYEFEHEPVDRNDSRNWIKVQSDNYGPDNSQEHKDIIYDQLGETFSSVVERPNGKFNRTYVYTWDVQAGKYVGVRERLVPVNGGAAIYNKISGYDDIVPEFKWDNGQAYRLRSYSLRASASLAIDGDESLSYYQTLPHFVAKFNRGSSAYFRKLSNWDTRKSETDIKPAMASGINYRLIRLADIYLMYAECLIKGGTDEGNLQTAINYINKVRHRSGVVLLGKSDMGEFSGSTYDETELTAQKVMEHLMYKERPLELCMEGQAIRVIDLRRWNVTKQRFDYLAKQKYCMLQFKFLKPNADDPTALNVAWNFGKQYRYEEVPPEKRGSSHVDFFQASLNYGPQVAYWPIPNIEITSNPDINK